MRYRSDRPRLDGGTRVLGRRPGAPSAKVAALQIGLRAKGLYGGTVDGVSGPLTRGAVLRLQRSSGIRATGKVGHATRCELGRLGKPLLGQRALSRGRVGWDVSVLEFRLRRFGLAGRRIDGRFDAATARAAAQIPALTRARRRRDRRRRGRSARSRGGRRR